MTDLEKRHPSLPSGEPSATPRFSRRAFLQRAAAASLLSATGAEALAPLMGSARPESIKPGEVFFTFLNHAHQSGLGWYFREGVVGNKEYHRAFYIFYDLQQTFEILHRFPYLTVCLELGGHSFEAVQQDDPEFVQQKLRPLISRGRIEILGGNYTEPYAQLVGWQSNIRQFTQGLAVMRDVLGQRVDAFIAEEIFFHPQVPQLLRLFGFKYASLNNVNNGSFPTLDQALISWEGLDGTIISTIPNNKWDISVLEQNKPLTSHVDAEARAQNVLLSIWAEIWPPGLDWGASYQPYDEWIESLHAAGVRSLGLSAYMRVRCGHGVKPLRQRYRMDDVTLLFGWPENRNSLWEKIGGWGYEGDVLLKQTREIEHQLNAAEQILSLAPDRSRSVEFRNLWKKFLLTENHDCFIVSGFPAEYNHVKTTNLEVTRMIAREVSAGIRRIREESIAALAHSKSSSALHQVLCQNATSVALRQPIEVVVDDGDHDYILERNGETVHLQRMAPRYTNDPPRSLGVIDLLPCAVKTYALRTGRPALASPPSQAEAIENGFYFIRWNEDRQGFAIDDKSSSRSLLFRPFSGDITHVTESYWSSPNSGVDFRAGKFSDVSFIPHVEAAGPVYHALAVRGDLLRLSTTASIPAWVTARALLYEGIPRIDIVTELTTYPRLEFLAFAEMLTDGGHLRIFRDFPFGEEETRKDEFSALNYVRLQNPDCAWLVAHGGTQQFFRETRQGSAVVRNMIAREVLKGSYRWTWSLTGNHTFSPAECYHFAEAARGAVVQQAPAMAADAHSWLSVSDPELVVFRVAADRERISVWLMNYSDTRRHGKLTLHAAVHSVARVDFDGRQSAGLPATLTADGSVALELLPWQIAAFELRRGRERGAES